MIVIVMVIVRVVRIVRWITEAVAPRKNVEVCEACFKTAVP